MKRRRFLLHSSTLVAALAAARAGMRSRPGHALGTPSAEDRKFIFIFNDGGWDPTRVFSPSFDEENVDMEDGAGSTSASGLTWVSHADRPSVDEFFQAYASQSAIVRGLYVPSVSHFRCQLITLTGNQTGLRPDWASIIGHDQKDRYPMPSLVLGGPSFPGELIEGVSRAGQNGQLAKLLSGEAIEQTDNRVTPPSETAESLADAYLSARVQERWAQSRCDLDELLLGAYAQGVENGQLIKGYRDTLVLDGGKTIADQAVLVAEVFSLGLSRVASMTFPGDYDKNNWDSHSSNDSRQSGLFEGLFSSLITLMAALEAVPGRSAATVAEETTLVIFSEMGRTPKLTAVGGKDHWFYTDALLVGSGIAGGQSVGGYDASFNGRSVDLATGEPWDEGTLLSIDVLGATLLSLADIDPEEQLGSGISPLGALIG